MNWIKTAINFDHKLVSLQVSYLFTCNEVRSSVSLSRLPSHPLITHYYLSSSVPFLASFACLTSLDSRVSHFIRFSHSLAPDLPFQSPRMGKYHHLPSQLPVPGCQTLPKKVTKPGWLVPLQFRAIWSQLAPCCLTILALNNDLQPSVFSSVNSKISAHPQFLRCYDLLVPRESQGQRLIAPLFFSLSKSSTSPSENRKVFSCSMISLSLS